jgi:hypothetical protein
VCPSGVFGRSVGWKITEKLILRTAGGEPAAEVEDCQFWSKVNTIHRAIDKRKVLIQHDADSYIGCSTGVSDGDSNLIWIRLGSLCCI